MTDSKIFYTSSEVAKLVGISMPTLNNWYRWKKQHPEHNLAKILPTPTRISGMDNSPRYWDVVDIERVKLFKELLPRGNKGVMASVTQKYTKSHKGGTTNVKTEN